MDSQKLLPAAKQFHQTRVLQRAIESGDVQRASLFLRLGCSPNEHSGEKQVTPLIMSCYQTDKKKRLEIIRLLMEHGSDPSLTDAEGNNVLHHACMLGLVEVASIISDSMDSYLYCTQNISGNTPLHICAEKGEAQILEIIVNKAIKHGQYLNIRNADGLTPLALACINEERECAKILHDSGATPRYSEIDLQLPICRTLPIVQESLLVSFETKELSLPKIIKQPVHCKVHYYQSSFAKQPSFSADCGGNNYCSGDIIKSLMGSKLYRANGRQAGNHAAHRISREPVTQEWIGDIHRYKPSGTFANIANLVVRSKSRAASTRRQRASRAVSPVVDQPH